MKRLKIQDVACSRELLLVVDVEKKIGLNGMPRPLFIHLPNQPNPLNHTLHFHLNTMHELQPSSKFTYEPCLQPRLFSKQGL